MFALCPFLKINLGELDVIIFVLLEIILCNNCNDHRGIEFSIECDVNFRGLSSKNYRFDVADWYVFKDLISMSLRSPSMILMTLKGGILHPRNFGKSQNSSKTGPSNQSRKWYSSHILTQDIHDHQTKDLVASSIDHIVNTPADADELLSVGIRYMIYRCLIWICLEWYMGPIVESNGKF